jgi:photosystem II stability/assembly factor-like uncharacterized protein
MTKSASDSTSVTVRRGRRDLIRPAAFVIALAMLITATLWMHFQPGVPDPLRPVDRFSRQWWLCPVELNGFMRLPLVSNEPDHLFVLPNSTHAWVGGGGGHSSNVLLHTADQGQTWEALTVAARAAKSSGVLEIVDFYFANPAHGWVLDHKGEILETRDSGKNWTSQKLEDSVYFTVAGSPSRLVVGGMGVFSSSTDGGKHWRTGRFPGGDVQVEALNIASDGRVWAATHNGKVWSSADPSKWERRSDSGVQSVHRIFFDTPRHGFVEGASVISETSDGGLTWKSSPSMRVPPKNEWINDLSNRYIHATNTFSDRRRSVWLGRHGQIFVSGDGGGIWRRATAPYRFVQALHADSDGKHLWAAGRSVSMLRSVDGGATWEPMNTSTLEDLAGTVEDLAGTVEDLSGVTFDSSRTRGWVVSRSRNENLVFVTQSEDGGETWKRRVVVFSEVLVIADLSGLSGDVLHDRTDVVIVSNDGMHVVVAPSLGIGMYEESKDSGRTWESESTHDSSPLSLDFFTAPNTGAFSVERLHWSVGVGDTYSIFRRGSGPSAIRSVIPATLLAVTATGENGWVAKDSFPTYRSGDGGRTWQATAAPHNVAIAAFRFLNSNNGFAEADDGHKFETSDGGTSWQPILRDPNDWRVLPLIANADGRRLWTASIDGVPLRSLDGGKTWLAPQYRRFPAPWYYLTFAPIALLLFVSMRKPAPVVRAEHSIEDVPWNDRPLTEPGADRLDYRPLAAGIARFFGNPGTEPPLTIAITGPWGSGKSSLMNLVADAVKRYDYRPVWFNAWHYQSEEFLLPAVLESLRTEAVPRFWTFHGLQFRMRLLLLRGMKNWLPALVIMAVLVTTAAYFMRDHDAFRQLLENFRNLGTEKSDKFFQSAGLLISSLLSIIIVFRSLNAFGVSGTKVAALLSGSVRLADAGGQTGFRHRFARAFGEVTRALGRNRLVLFIDDLDRCRPDHVLSVLECINFLVTSGDCFIIAGMDRPRVERCVAMRFEEESKNIGADENADGENDPVTPVRYAQLYLEKLINIEVPVPLAASSRSRELFAGDPKDAGHERVRATVFGERLIAFGQAAIPWVVGVAVLAGAAYLGYTVLPDRYPQQRPAQTIVVTAPAAATKSPVARTPAGVPSQTSPEKQPDVQRPTRFARPILASRREVLPIIGIVLIVIGGIVRLSIERAKLEQDSKDFRIALRQWHPLIYAANATPRSMKRCVNRVRYYAMRQRTNPLPPTLPERLVRLAQRLRRIAPLPDDTPLAIPENVLVPVSVVQHVHPEWLEDEAFWRDPAAYIEAHNPPAELGDGIDALREYGSIEGYRSVFRHISAGIHVAGTADGRIVDPISGTAS